MDVGVACPVHFIKKNRSTIFSDYFKCITYLSVPLVGSVQQIKTIADSFLCLIKNAHLLIHVGQLRRTTISSDCNPAFLPFSILTSQWESFDGFSKPHYQSRAILSTEKQPVVTTEPKSTGHEVRGWLELAFLNHVGYSLDKIQHWCNVNTGSETHVWSEFQIFRYKYGMKVVFVVRRKLYRSFRIKTNSSRNNSYRKR